MNLKNCFIYFFIHLKYIFFILNCASPMKFAQGLKLILKLIKSEKEICDKIIFYWDYLLSLINTFLK